MASGPRSSVAARVTVAGRPSARPAARTCSWWRTSSDCSPRRRGRDPRATPGRQRPKFDRYIEHDFLTSYLVRFDERSGQLSTGEIAAFITPSALVTVRRDRDWPIEKLMGRWDDEVSLTGFGVGGLLHGLLMSSSRGTSTRGVAR